MEPAGKASEPAGWASEPAGMASEPAGRASEPAERPQGGRRKEKERKKIITECTWYVVVP